LSFSCAQCRARLTTGQTMCRCGQVFPFPVPEFSESYNSMYWPPASASQPAALNWWNDLSPAIKASVGGAVVLVVALIAVGGSVHQYQTMHARYAPGRLAMVASAAPARVQPPTTPLAPSAPAPLVLQAAPRYVPPKGNEIASNIPRPVNQQSLASDAPPPVIMAPNVAASQVTPAQYASALSDAEKAVYDARDYVNNLTPQDFQRAPISLQPFLSRVKQDRSTMLGSPTVSPRDMAEVNADQRGIQDMEDTCNQNRGAASTNMG